MIKVDSSVATSGVKAIRDATADFDETVASKSPISLDAGAAQVLLADVLSTTAQVALNLVYELDTLAANADAGLGDLTLYDASASCSVAGLGAVPE